MAAFSVVCYGVWIFYDTTVRENSEGAPSESSVQNGREEGTDSERITEKASPLRTGSETEGGNNIVIFDHAQTENRFSPSLENENSSIYVIGEDTGESIESPQADSETEIHRYELIRKDCSWTQAFVECQSKGGYLARIDTDEEYAYILGEIERQNMKDCKFFLGGRRDASDRKYYWVDEKNHLIGECLNNPSSWCIGEWMENEPSFSDGEIQEAYINMFYYSEENRWVWNDIPDNILDVMPTYAGTIGFICEYEE
ncbi:MAG TPA: C-type lectin domain-containing protein [Candidatus Choladousia intestinigallinarum]|nr:C-type lectin domain-containing protein [Candidatus Choladousia intestinigallinarum]